MSGFVCSQCLSGGHWGGADPLIVLGSPEEKAPLSFPLAPLDSDPVSRENTKTGQHDMTLAALAQISVALYHHSTV